MSNLLPIEAQKSMWSSERARFLIIASLVSLITSFICALAIAPAYVVLMFSGTTVSGPAQNTLTPSVVQADAAAIAEAQTYLSLAPTVAKIASSTETLGAILAVRPRGVMVNHIVYSAGTPSTFLLSGLADGRENINAYRAILSSDPRYQSVSVPVSNLVGTDGSFTVTVKGSF